MKKLLFVSLLLGSQINYASHEKQYDSAKTQEYAAMYGAGLIMAISGICISGNVLIKDSNNDSQGSSYAVGTMLVATGGGMMGYSFAKLLEVAPSQKIKNLTSPVCMSAMEQGSTNNNKNHQD